ncbi:MULTISPECIES: DUF2510 domain-containing protein [Amycolatopsis]|uniref:DUF2510 domain-containing protein n=1 Tax=Amycolatopsis bullii TaxID=941987 RepID=A0ABQ3KBA2_9PSEU|nr:DUF2510 domain-containing protein [Amycolatopsis bullii]GHG12231.1 hypothetical protein GCM10017567_32050 [Amycolatopsis bullii]
MTRSPMAPVRSPGWFTDPLDERLIRYWDGRYWTFHTADRPKAAAPKPEPAEAPPPALRPDIAQAVSRVSGLLVGSRKEVNLLAAFLRPEERVLALTGAQGEGFGVLACTTQRLLFLFVGIVRKQVLEVDWNQAKAAVYNRSTKFLAVYTTRPSKRAIPAMAVRVNNVSDAHAIVNAAEAASAAPRLDIV